MSLIEWSDTLSVGIATIDEQHKRLITLINELHAAMLARQGVERLGHIFSELIDYTESHFTYEEELFDSHGYESSTQHKAQHRALTARVYELKAQFESGSTAVALEVSNFLRDWLREHIIGNDKKYAKYLRERGVS